MTKSDPRFAGSIKISNPGEYLALLLIKNMLRLRGGLGQSVFLWLVTRKPREPNVEISLVWDKLRWLQSISLKQVSTLTIENFRKLLNS